MASLTARIQPTSRSARSVLGRVGAALRQQEHVSVSANETLRELPGLGTLLVTELPGELILDFSGPSSSEPSRVREAISQQIRHAAGSRSAAAKLVVTWAQSPTQLSPRAVDGLP